MELDPDLDALLKKWGSEEAIYKFLREEFEQTIVRAFEGRLSLPNFQVKPMWLSKGLMGERNSGADYQPVEGDRPAEIGMFTAVLLDRDKAHRVLAHEMIHHWEGTIARHDESTKYPRRIDKEIKKAFPNSVREHSWRLKHSRRFISKAHEVAQVLNVPTRNLLFGDRIELFEDRKF